MKEVGTLLQVSLSSGENSEKANLNKTKLAALYASAGRRQEAIDLLEPLCKGLEATNSTFLTAQCQLADIRVGFCNCADYDLTAVLISAYFQVWGGHE